MSGKPKSGGAAGQRRPTTLHEDAPPCRTDVCSVRPAAEADRATGSTLHPLRFIDLFCGIGGFRIAFERAGARCVFSSDWDKFSRQTYAANFGEGPAGGINILPLITGNE